MEREAEYTGLIIYYPSCYISKCSGTLFSPEGQCSEVEEILLHVIHEDTF
jgi:hypothetical protein